jgi:hypothetical protein
LPAAMAAEDSSSTLAQATALIVHGIGSKLLI